MGKRTGHTGEPNADRRTLAIPDIEGVEIHCDQANLRSVAVARRLEFTLIEVRDHSIDAPGQSGRSMVWLKKRPEFETNC